MQQNDAAEVSYKYLLYMHVHLLIALVYFYSNLLFLFSTDICFTGSSKFYYYHVMGISDARASCSKYYCSFG